MSHVERHYNEVHPDARAEISAVLQGDILRVRGRLLARDRSIPLELDARIREADGELEIEATTIAPHRELALSWSPLGMIPPRSELVVDGRLMAIRS